MKILFVCTLYSPYISGGAEVTLKTLVEGLRDAGIEVVVLTLGPRPGLTKEEVGGIPVWRAGIRNLYFHFSKVQPPKWKRKLWHLFDVYNPLMKSYIRQVVEMERPDVASCHNLIGWSISAWDALSDKGIPIVQVLHDQYLLCPRSTMFRKENRCKNRCFSCLLMRASHSLKSRQVSAVVGVSGFILNKLLNAGYFKDVANREVIHNVRNFPSFEAFPPAHENIVFGFIGSLVPFKGIELLLETFIKHAKYNWVLKIAGNGDAKYESMLIQKYSDRRIQFCGYCSQKDFFQSLDITVVPSLWEDTFPGVVFESLIFGVPVLGSNRGGIPEMISNGANGILFEPDDPESLAKSLTLAVDLTHRVDRSFIQQSASSFSDCQGWCSRWIELYQMVVNG